MKDLVMPILWVGIATYALAVVWLFGEVRPAVLRILSNWRSPRRPKMPLVRTGDVPVNLPRYAHPGDAGLDLQATIAEPRPIPAHGRTTIPTGIRASIPPGHVGLVLPRSGLLRNAGVGAGVGVIDAGYRGILGVTLLNHSPEAHMVKPLERIAQLVIVPAACVECVEVAELEETERGANGFGSTGR